MNSQRTTSRGSSASTYDPKSCRALCWGLLYHALGLTEEALNKLAVVDKKSDLSAIAKAVMAYSSVLKKPDHPFEERQRGLVDIVEALGKVLDPKECGGSGPRLSSECPRYNGERKAVDGTKAGYSRDPFKRLDNQDRRREVSLAAILYIARAHAVFFAHPRALRSFNAAKVALNDLFQAGRLAARLSYSCDNASHLKQFSQHAYIGDVLRGPANSSDGEPHDSSYFIWWLLELVEIQRGNIYRQIEHLEQGERHYRHAQKRFERLVMHSIDVSNPGIVRPHDPAMDRWFITPTLVLALSERAKIQFDLGHLVESIGGDLLCLAFLVRRVLLEKPQLRNGLATSLLEDVSQAIEYLRVAQRQETIDMESATRFFKSAARTADRESLTPERFAEFLRRLPDPERKLAADLFARLGFSLFPLWRRRLALRPWSNSERTEAVKAGNRLVAWLKPYFTVYKNLKLKQAPPLALYCISLLPGRSVKKEEVAFPDILERQLAQRLREALPRKRYGGAKLDESDLCCALLELATRNIDNIVTIPRRTERFLMRMGYKARRKKGDVSAKTVTESLRRSLSPSSDEQGNTGHPRDKLVVLRRWQSFNPRIPRPVPGTIRGGGFFLLWRGKGIVIDPGYDFIQNFYEEGFSLEDIAAVVVTHSHPDHDNDLSTLTTLVREWDDLKHRLGESEMLRLDLFLNESTHLKFSAWLKASQTVIGRIVPTPLVVWNENSKKPNEAIRGENTVLDLTREYALRIEVVPAWHDDVIGKTAAVGLKFHLFDRQGKVQPGEEPLGKIGYTGDTSAYGRDGKCGLPPIEDMYDDCDVLIANLGDIRLRELSTRLGTSARSGESLLACLDQLLQDWFCSDNRALQARINQSRVEEFLHLLINLDLADEEALEGKLAPLGQKTVAKVLNDFITKNVTGSSSYEDLETALRTLATGKWGSITKHIQEAEHSGNPNQMLAPWQVAYALLGYLCITAQKDWPYEYHLGIEGIYRLQSALCRNAAKDPLKTRMLIVSELPEELSSYRHFLAQLLNMAKCNWLRKRRLVHAFTGDIGLHIGLTDFKGEKWMPQIRCAYCNYNNESVLKGMNYHEPEKILETPVKRLGSAMVYLCKAHDHHPENEDLPRDLIDALNLRAV